LRTLDQKNEQQYSRSGKEAVLGSKSDKNKMATVAGALQYQQNPVLQNVLAYGAETFVPNHDVCRLSYHLKCCTIGCGIDLFLNHPLIDYQVAHLLPVSIQHAIFRLAFEDFRLDLLVNRAFILDEEHVLLPRGTLNTFYKFEMASTFFALDRFAVVAGQRLEIHKVMLCTAKWMQEYYLNPLARFLQQQHQQQQPAAPLPNMSTTIVQAQSVVDDDDSDSGMGYSDYDDDDDYDDFIDDDDVACVPAQLVLPQQPSSLLSSTASQSSSPSQQNQPTAESVIATEVYHSTRPSCIIGRTTACAVCHSPPNQNFGSWYRCMGCVDTDFCLCEACYQVGEYHDQTHAFAKIRFDGSNPQPIGPQIQACAANHCSALLPDLPLAMAVPLHHGEIIRTRNAAGEASKPMALAWNRMS
jgi:hypothetical protein